MKKILVCEFSQESNSFNPMVWELDRFRSMVLSSGLKMKIMYSLLKSPIKGMVDAIKKSGAKPVYGTGMRAISGGRVSDDSVEFFLSQTMECIDRKGPFDGAVLSLHGATISQSEEDACGYITEKIRNRLGKNAVIGLACDMHANVTKRMEANADYICGFQTYPHVDFYQTGYRAASLVMDKLSGRGATQTYCRMPMMVPASGYTTEDEVFGGIIRECHSLVESGKAKDFSVFMMQPWLDVKEAASCVSIVSEDTEWAEKEGSRIARKVFDERDQFWPQLMNIEEIINAAEKNESGRPVVLAEPSDSPNGGAVGDSVEVIRKIKELDSHLKTVTFVTDPAAAKRAHELGEGKRAVFSIGAAYTPDMQGPIELECSVISLHKGTFRLAGPAGKGLRLNIGTTAVLRHGNMDIMVCERPGAIGDVNFYKSFGMDPSQYDMVVVKANTSFRESYKHIAEEIYIADTYGAGSGNLTELPFKIIDKNNFYPFNKNPEF